MGWGVTAGVWLASSARWRWGYWPFRRFQIEYALELAPTGRVCRVCRVVSKTEEIVDDVDVGLSSIFSTSRFPGQLNPTTLSFACLLQFSSSSSFRSLHQLTNINLHCHSGWPLCSTCRLASRFNDRGQVLVRYLFSRAVFAASAASQPSHDCDHPLQLLSNFPLRPLLAQCARLRERVPALSIFVRQISSAPRCRLVT